MKKINSILVALVALFIITTSCEPEYFKPENPKYKVGDIIKIKLGMDSVEAFVYFVSFDGEHGKAIAIKDAEAPLQWSTTSLLVGANSETNGYFNQNKVQSRPRVSGDDWRLIFPAFYTAFNTAHYEFPISDETLLIVKWYIPSVEEYRFIFQYFNLINSAIPNGSGYVKLRENVEYWTSTEVDEINAKIVKYNNGIMSVENKMKTNNSPYYRAIIAF